jgi:catechol 2,3-dioxygenase-like lactoylglutathione lyase family enzyme
MIAGLDHIAIRTADIASTKRFFVDALGFTEGWRPDIPFPGSWLYWNGRPIVHLSEVEQPSTPSKGSSLDHFAFTIDDFEAARARLEACGIAYEERRFPEFGIFQLNVRDASGVLVELNKTVPLA